MHLIKFYYQYRRTLQGFETKSAGVDSCEHAHASADFEICLAGVGERWQVSKPARQVSEDAGRFQDLPALSAFSRADFKMCQHADTF